MYYSKIYRFARWLIFVHLCKTLFYTHLKMSYIKVTFEAKFGSWLWLLWYGTLLLDWVKVWNRSPWKKIAAQYLVNPRMLKKWFFSLQIKFSSTLLTKLLRIQQTRLKSIIYSPKINKFIDPFGWYKVISFIKLKTDTEKMVDISF